MARTPAETTPTPPDHQQMNRSNDPETTRAMDEAAPGQAMASRQRLTGSAAGVGSVGFDEDGAFDVGDPARDPRDNPEAD
ncbi:MAG: Tat pathway signal protein [Brevundimonas sp.]|nr:Tat pathway signal protein [Brevundimonas sp.]